jgi:hypothetical protein
MKRERVAASFMIYLHTRFYASNRIITEQVGIEAALCVVFRLSAGSLAVLAEYVNL